MRVCVDDMEDRQQDWVNNKMENDDDCDDDALAVMRQCWLKCSEKIRPNNGSVRSDS